MQGLWYKDLQCEVLFLELLPHDQSRSNPAPGLQFCPAPFPFDNPSLPSASRSLQPGELWGWSSGQEFLWKEGACSGHKES